MHCPFPTQCGVLAMHLFMFSVCPSALHEDTVLRSAAQLDELGEQTSQLSSVGLHRPAPHALTRSKPVRAVLHFSRLSPTQLRAPAVKQASEVHAPAIALQGMPASVHVFSSSKPVPSSLQRCKTLPVH